MTYFIANTAFRLLLFCLFLGTLTNEMHAQNAHLKNYVWHKRVLLVFAPDAQNEAFKQQNLAIKEGKKGFEDRDLVVITIFNASGLDEKNKLLNRETAISLRKKYKVLDDEFKVILIGKDGGAKKTATLPMSNQQLFNLIDAMPMRKDEMKNGR
jgi:Domain of unknown function (DUF4174)